MYIIRGVYRPSFDNINYVEIIFTNMSYDLRCADFVQVKHRQI